ncbi:MAG: hypothetical protein EFKGCFLK_02205 [Rhodocyclaceae bacterium]|nr:MAG: hypothetical protein F9K21_08980 [Rhodocyclaceae bacterium]MBE7422243.1 hypothetical protein [Zoogloeaceae bacterium]MBV6408608.1 hypothetical protein [Rhodocyclaceae bacterium]CAG0930637.1 hypothetical protein RHDC3_01559 [Rhodocyclaceae bacterium]
MPDYREEPFDTRAAYQTAVDLVLSRASKEICIFDPDLKALELDSRSRADAIGAFLAAGRDRNLRIVLHDPDYLTRYSARLSALRKRYSHCFQFRQTPEPLRGIADCFVLADGASGAIRFHADHFRGKLLLDRPLVIHDWQQRFEELWIESTPCTSATQLGL